MLMCLAWENGMLARCQQKLKKIFAGELLGQFKMAFRKPRRLGCSG